jgi:putative transposase
MPHYQLFFHIVWTTKNRTAWIQPDIEPTLYGVIKQKTINLEAQIFAVNGFKDHIHLVVSVPPKIALANFIGEIKGYSSFCLNRLKTGGGPFHWQAEYAVFSLDKASLFTCVDYVERQTSHHSSRGGIKINWEPSG